MRERLLKIILFLACISWVYAGHVSAEPNVTIDSFSKSKRLLLDEVYQDHRLTLYCSAGFDEHKSVYPQYGFNTKVYKKRATRIEWEHMVAAQWFGQTFKAWSFGDSQCVSKGKLYKGRKCADKVSKEYRLMQADMYNLAPAIGAVNALRSNHPFGIIDADSDFGACDFEDENSVAEPPESSRGRIARAHLYMDLTYDRYTMDDQTRELMTGWDNSFPVTAWECERYRRIKNIQKNDNPVLAERCK